MSDFGDQITTALLALCVLDITKSTGKVGLVYFITTLGFVIFTLVGGYLGDRLSKKNILFYSDIGRGFVVLLMIVALTHKSIFLIYLTSFLLSILGSLHRPVKLSIWAHSVPESCLERYNSFSEFSTQASMILGPLIASFFIAGDIINFGFAVDAATFFICAITFIVVISEKNRTVCTNQASKRNLLHGFKLITKTQEIYNYVTYDAIQMIGFGAFNATFLVLAQRDFGWTKSEYSYHLSIIAIFALIGASLGTTKTITTINALTKLAGCALISALALGMVLFFRTFPIGSILYGICNGLAVVTMVVTRTRVQLLAKSKYPDSLSSILASRSIIIKAATLLGVGSCLIIDDFLRLEITLCFYLIPIAFSFLPFIIGQKDRLPVQGKRI